MAANPKSRGLASLGKRVVSQIWSGNSRDPALPAVVFRSAHFSVYDKNPDDQLRPGVVVPDELIQPQSDKYWSPHPQTGVFGPAAGENSGTATAGAGVGRGRAAVNGNGGGGGAGTVLEEKAWFRPTSLEDLEKPQH